MRIKKVGLGNETEQGTGVLESERETERQTDRERADGENGTTGNHITLHSNGSQWCHWQLVGTTGSSFGRANGANGTIRSTDGAYVTIAVPIFFCA